MSREPMFPSEMARFIEEALYEYADGLDGNESEQVDDILTFSDAGLFTSDTGLVVKMGDGREFQVTVVRSK